MDRKNISALLSNYHLVVPEIQREYVWGDPKNRPVITQFLRDISDKALKGDVNVGFLYSYQSGSEHYLIDGQQRYTTLVVLLYYLSLGKEENHQRFLELLSLDSASPAFREAFAAAVPEKEYKNAYSTKNEEFFYRWGIASLFHDVGYPLEIIGRQLNEFTGMIADADGKDIKVKAKISFDNLEELRTISEIVPKDDFSSSYVKAYREAAERVGAYLKGQGFVCSVFHGGLEQDKRERALFLFAGGAANVLVSTDLSARGLDIRSLRHIVHYHLPVHPGGDRPLRLRDRRRAKGRPAPRRKGLPSRRHQRLRHVGRTRDRIRLPSLVGRHERMAVLHHRVACRRLARLRPARRGRGERGRGGRLALHLHRRTQGPHPERTARHDAPSGQGPCAVDHPAEGLAADRRSNQRRPHPLLRHKTHELRRGARPADAPEGRRDAAAPRQPVRRTQPAPARRPATTCASARPARRPDSPLPPCSSARRRRWRRSCRAEDSPPCP